MCVCMCACARVHVCVCVYKRRIHSPKRTTIIILPYTCLEWKCSSVAVFLQFDIWRSKIDSSCKTTALWPLNLDLCTLLRPRSWLGRAERLAGASAPSWSWWLSRGRSHADEELPSESCPPGGGGRSCNLHPLFTYTYPPLTQHVHTYNSLLFQSPCSIFGLLHPWRDTVATGGWIPWYSQGGPPAGLVWLKWNGDNPSLGMRHHMEWNDSGLPITIWGFLASTSACVIMSMPPTTTAGKRISLCNSVQKGQVSW